ncbi:MAG: putative Alkaline-phosphatase-like, core domain [Phenylobacterium sp.]|nr:putative Alkaline-phosphatase-like, core domain [Phenylobacterium sp.]
MTSTRPLSYGGFDGGIEDRPPTIAAALSGEGYHTTHLTSVRWVNSLFGYTSDDEVTLFSPKSMARAIGTLIKDPLTRYASGALDFGQADQLTRTRIAAFFDWIQRTCTAKLQFSGGTLRSLSIEPQRYRWRALSSRLAAEEMQWRTDREAFLLTAARSLARGGPWLPSVRWDLLRTTGDLAQIGPGAALAYGLQKHAPRVAARLRNRRKPYPDAAQMIDAVLATAERRRGSAKPFYIWAHLFDAHIPYSFGQGRSWLRQANYWLERTGHDPKIDPLTAFTSPSKNPSALGAWTACYDAAVAFIDSQIGRLRAELNARGLGNTLLVLSSDHGEELGEHGDTSHRFRLYDHNCRVHFSVHHPDLAKSSVPGLCTLMDVAPTIVDLTATKRPEGWEGQALSDLKQKPRTGVVLETFFGSPCDPSRRPMYFASRSENHKLMWCERVAENDPLSLPGARLFDLTSDPTEQIDIAAGNDLIVARLMEPMLRRKAELEADFGGSCAQFESAG